MQNSSQLLYSGEIITDADDDSKTYRYTYRNSYSNDDANQSSILYSGYNYYEKRNIGLVTVKGAVK